MIRRRPISEREVLDKTYRTLVHAIYYIGPDERETCGILETARRALFLEKFKFTKYPMYGHHCKNCHHYRRRHAA